MKFPHQSPVAKSEEELGALCSPADDGPRATGGYLDHFHQIATMIEVLDRLPDFAGDIRDWRPRIHGERLAGAPHGQRDEILRAYGELSPLTQRAFQAVVAGIDKLAESAVELCDHTHKPPTAGEIKAGADLGKSMRQLLERAKALVESAGAPGGAGRQRSANSWRIKEK
jgi:hypothetical protein